MRKSCYQLNFVPSDRKPRSLKLYFFMILPFCFVGLFMFLAFTIRSKTTSLALELSHLERRAGEVEAKISALVPAPGEVKEKDEVKMLEPFRERGKWSTCFKEFTLLAPEGLWIQELNVEVSPLSRSYKLTGQTGAQEKVTKFFSAMEKSFCYEKAKVSYVEELPGFEPPLYKFEFQFESIVEPAEGGKNASTQ